MQVIKNGLTPSQALFLTKNPCSRQNPYYSLNKIRPKNKEVVCGIVTDHTWWSEYYKTQSLTPVNDMPANETAVHTTPSTSMIRLTSHQKNQILCKKDKSNMH